MSNAPLPDDTPTEEPANLRFLRRLVTVLTGTMIVGVVVIIGLIVMRLNRAPAAAPAIANLPSSISLPKGATALAFTQGTGWYAVVTDANQILIFDAASGKLRQTVDVQN